MEANSCDVNNLDADVLLPPRKRLLAGLKKQNFDGSSQVPSTSVILSEFDIQLSNMLKSHSNKSPEEIAEVSRSAAEAAKKVAKAARAAAGGKAEIAAKAMAAAKSALDLFAMMSEETSSRENYLRKNKMKRQVPVDILYNKKQRVETDEKLARDLHRAINSSPRTIKNSSTSDIKSSKHKRLVKSLSSQKLRYNNDGIMWDGHRPPVSNVNGTTAKLYAEGSAQAAYVVRIDEDISNSNKVDKYKMTNGGAVSSPSGEKMKDVLEDPCSLGRKRGRIKQKKLPLSVCNFRDQESPKEQMKHRSLSLSEENVSKDTISNKHMFSVGPASSNVMSIERSGTWKCKEFKAPACVKQNKVMQL